MNTTLDALSRAELRVLARVRLSLTVHLAAILGEAEPELRKLALKKHFILSLSAPGLPPAYVRSDGSSLTAFAGGSRPPTGLSALTLHFASARAAAKSLSGGGGSPLPFFRGRGGFSALGFFRKAAGRLAQLLSDPEAPAELRARLLAAAALRGLAEVANADPWLASRLAHIPDGSLVVEAPHSFAFGLEKRGSLLSVGDRAPENPSARLSFRDPESAVAVFSGQRPAAVALGAGEVAIHGLLPLVQGLFAVLDRLGDYLAVRAK